jgi:DNA-directed RNA polymerase subunit alpha
VLSTSSLQSREPSEDATDVILNLKQVPFKLHGNEPKTLTISKTGAGEVTAGDIQADGDVEILDSTVHIATSAAAVL